METMRNRSDAQVSGPDVYTQWVFKKRKSQTLSRAKFDNCLRPRHDQPDCRLNLTGIKRGFLVILHEISRLSRDLVEDIHQTSPKPRNTQPKLA
jgi:hypothetical protein